MRAPGRANLIGEHTDYNEGFVLPVALDAAAYVLGRRADDLRLRSLEAEGEVVVDLGTGEGPTDGWGRYVTAVVRALRDDGIGLHGLHGVLHSEVPAGSGLSSSAALEIAVATAISVESLDAVRLAEICRRAENHYVGVDTGIMDQLASAAGRAGHALLIDCRDNRFSEVPVPDDLLVLVIDSTVQRGLDDSAYNERRKQCRAACRALGVASLRDADLGLLESHDDLDQVIVRRARHVITENARVLECVDALKEGRLDRIEALFEASHRSLAEDYEVSIPELDALVEAARATEGILGARLTGAGFGGCTVNLVEEPRARSAAAEAVARYASSTGNRARFWLSHPAQGATKLPLPG
ncbi:galactokinase [soil metagenome]